jgi:proteasome lid subunit RPN8/RPN11
VLRFSPYAWAKLLYLRDKGPSEIGGFGITSAKDPLYVEDFVTIPQAATSVTIVLDDSAVADYLDAQVDAGRRPADVLRVWIHTHPGNSPEPSSVDEEMFHRVFGPSDYAVMAIVARGGKTYGRIRFNAGPGGQHQLTLEVDYSRPFAGSDQKAWDAEYHANIRRGAHGLGEVLPDLWDWPGLDLDCLDDAFCFDQQALAEMDPHERRTFLSDMGVDPDVIDINPLGEKLEVLP